MTISRRTEITQAGVDQLNVLMKELRGNAEDSPVGSLEDVRAILREKNIAMITVNDGDTIVGVATLYLMPKVGKLVSHLEDVVVSHQYRGQGLGALLVSKVIEVARELGVVSIALTSRPERVAANKLYQKLGFEQKVTNPYRLKL